MKPLLSGLPADTAKAGIDNGRSAVREGTLGWDAQDWLPAVSGRLGFESFCKQNEDNMHLEKRKHPNGLTGVLSRDLSGGIQFHFTSLSIFIPSLPTLYL